MADYRFKQTATSEAGPARNAAAVTPNDSTDLTNPAKALWVGTAGDVKVDTHGGDTVTFANVSGLLPVAVRRVHSTGTDATDIVAIW